MISKKTACDKIYDVLQKEDNYLGALFYFLSIPWLVSLNIIGCLKTPFDPRPWVMYYTRPTLPADPVPYDEYLLVMKYIHENVEEKNVT